MVNRLAAIDRTRRTILDAARELVASAGGAGLTIQGLAERAAVSRPTVYEQFGSRRGVIEALIADAEQRGGVRAAIQAADHPDAGQAVVAWLTWAARFWAAEHKVLGAAFALAMSDPEMRGVLQAHDDARRRRAVHLTRRLARDGRLRSGLSRTDVVELLCMLSSHATFRELSRDGERPASAVARIVVHVATEALLL